MRKSGIGLLPLCMLVMLLWSGLLEASTSRLASVAFFYGADLPLDSLSQFDQVVIEPQHVTAVNLKKLKQDGAEVYAYLSLGEVADNLWLDYGLPDNLAIGSNQGWGSVIVDQTSLKWHRFVLDKLIPPLLKEGYDGLFLDTLDSYQLAVRDKSKIEAQRQGLEQLITQIHQRYPQLKLFFNRGFELLPKLHKYVDALAAESLYYSFDPLNKRYRKTSLDDQRWLKAELQKVKGYGIPVTVIDYLPPNERKKAWQMAKKITAGGYTPWISNSALNYLGVGLIEPEPRQVLMLYDSHESYLRDHYIHIFAAMVAEQLGLVPVYHDVASQSLPDEPLTGRYAGVISWLSSLPPDMPQMQVWVEKQINDNVPILFFGLVPVTDSLLFKRMGIRLGYGKLHKPLKVVKKTSQMEYEAKLPLKSRFLEPLVSTNKKNQPWLTLKDKRGQQVSPVMITPWGGFAIAPYILTDNGSGYRQWLVDPFALISKSLKLKPLPIPDTTTENGRRILLSHIDGDGFASRAEFPGSPYSGEILMDHVFKRYDIPHTVSVVEGETGPEGLYPHLSPLLESMARELFKLPNVELATHTYSHPFFWQPNKNWNPDSRNKKQKDALYGGHLPIPGYSLDFRREVYGSIDYINQNLAPKGKQVKVFLWSGDAAPDESTVALTRKAGVVNLNGGNSYMTRAYPSVTGLYPQGVPLGNELQVYAPVINENVYTNDWTGPFYGYRKVIETFELTESPRRLKPVSIYWHFYSGTKVSALRALTKVYDWALEQPVLPLYISEYAPKINGFYSTTFIKNQKGQWLVSGLEKLRTLRIDPVLGYPDLSCSRHVAGFIDLPQGRYLHLSDQTARLCFSKYKSGAVYLEQANVPIKTWRYLSPDKVSLQLKGHQDIEFTVISSKNCTFQGAWGDLHPHQDHTRQLFRLSAKDSGHATLSCH